MLVKQIISFILLSTLVVPAFAGTVLDSRGLSEEQKAQVQIEIERMKKKADQTPVVTTEKLNEYTRLGQNIAKAIIGVASELGKSVDELLNTKLGKIILILVIWQVVGKVLIGPFIAFLWLLFWVPIWTYYFRRFTGMGIVKKTYDDKGHLVSKERGKMQWTDGIIGYFSFAGIIMLVTALIFAFAIG